MKNSTQHPANQNRKQLKRKWFIYGGVGLALMGAGLSVFGEALMLKQANNGFWGWFSYGTLSLVLFNAGMSFFGEAIKTKILLEQTPS